MKIQVVRPPAPVPHVRRPAPDPRFVALELGPVVRSALTPQQRTALDDLHAGRIAPLINLYLLPVESLKAGNPALALMLEKQFGQALADALSEAHPLLPDIWKGATLTFGTYRCVKLWLGLDRPSWWPRLICAARSLTAWLALAARHLGLAREASAFEAVGMVVTIADKTVAFVIRPEQDEGAKLVAAIIDGAGKIRGTATGSAAPMTGSGQKGDK